MERVAWGQLVYQEFSLPRSEYFWVKNCIEHWKRCLYASVQTKAWKTRGSKSDSFSSHSYMSMYARFSSVKTLQAYHNIVVFKLSMSIQRILTASVGCTWSTRNFSEYPPAPLLSDCNERCEPAPVSIPPSLDRPENSTAEDEAPVDVFPPFGRRVSSWGKLSITSNQTDLSPRRSCKMVMTCSWKKKVAASFFGWIVLSCSKND